MSGDPKSRNHSEFLCNLKNGNSYEDDYLGERTNRMIRGDVKFIGKRSRIDQTRTDEFNSDQASP